MESTRKTILEAGLGGLAVAIFILVIVAAGAVYGDGLGETGALVVIASMALFVVVMSLMGYWLSSRD